MRILIAFLLAFAAPLWAEPQRYTVVSPQADLLWSGAGLQNRGSIPLVSWEVVLDLDQTANSSLRFDFDARRARSGVPMGNPILRGPDILSAEAHPVVRFTAAGFSWNGAEVTVPGTMRMRGRSVPLTLTGQMGRAGDDLAVRVQGTFRLSDYGSNGAGGLVADQVTIDFYAVLRPE